MIRREEADSVWLIHQAAHAFISGQIAEHWIGQGTSTLSLREELVIAATCHDAGWARAEQHPQINADGQPRTFTEMDMDDHFVIWTDSIEAVFVQNRYAGLLTSLHCSDLYQKRLRFLADPPPARARIHDFLEERQTWEKRLIEALSSHPRYALAVEEQALACNLRLLQVWDYLSLVICMRTVHEQTLEDVPIGGGERVLLRIAGSGPRGMTLDPFPLDQPLMLWIDARQLPGVPFDSDEALRRMLAGVPYKPLVFEIGPAS
jgi:hypothetical protein